MADDDDNDNNLDPSARPRHFFRAVQGVNQRFLVGSGVQTVDDEADEAVRSFNRAVVLQEAGGKEGNLDVFCVLGFGSTFYVSSGADCRCSASVGFSFLNTSA